MFPDNYCVLVVGGQSTGMFEFCCYLGASYLKAGERLVFVNTSTSPDALRRQMGEFGVNAYEHEIANELTIVDCYTRPQVQFTDITIRVRDIGNLEEVLERVTEGIVKVGGAPVKVIFHSITPLVMDSELDVVREFFDALSSMVKMSGKLTCSVHGDMLSSKQVAELSSLSDGVLEMKLDDDNRRFVRIRQFTGMRVSPKWVPFDFEKEDEVSGTFLTWKGSK